MSMDPLTEQYYSPQSYLLPVEKAALTRAAKKQGVGLTIFEADMLYYAEIMEPRNGANDHGAEERARTIWDRLNQFWEMRVEAAHETARINALRLIGAAGLLDSNRRG